MALRAAFPATIPVMTGFLCLGTAYGLLMQSKGYGPGWSVLMSAIAFGGSMQFVAVTLLTTAFDPVQAFLLSVMVNARHMFYGLSLLDKYKGLGKVRPFLIYVLCDETLSLGSTLEPPEGVARKDFYFWISLLPMVVTFVLINGFGVELLYGLTAGCVLSLLFFCKSLGGIKGFGEIVSEGFNNGIFPCIIIAAVVGVGKVVSATDVFALVQENIINLPLPGLVKVAAITTIIAGITGSASGGLTIALELFGETFISWGYTPEIIHRVASIACGGLDTLPWNGTVVMLFALSGVSYKKGYKHVAMETVILPLLSLIPVFIYYSIVH